MKDFIAELKTRGYWEFTIHPNKFESTKIKDYSSLQTILEKAVVHAHGWDFPHVSRNMKIIKLKDSIQQIIDFQHQRECWQFFQSGLFYMVKGLPEDWRDHSDFWPATKDWKFNQNIGVFGIVSAMTNFFEFSARLSLTEAGSEKMNLKYKVGNLLKRSIYGDHPKTFFPFTHQSDISEFDFSFEEMDRQELISKPLELAKTQSAEIMKRFGFTPSPQLLEMLQTEVK